MSTRLITLAEDYYGITAEVRAIDGLFDDFSDDQPLSNLTNALEALDVISDQRVTGFTEIVISSRKIDVSSSPSFVASICNGEKKFDKDMIIDSGCTGRGSQ